MGTQNEFFEFHYYIKVVLNNPIERKYNFPELILFNILKQEKKLIFYNNILEATDIIPGRGKKRG